MNLGEVDWSKIGTRIALLRQRKALTIREVARRADVDKNTYLRLERGLALRMETFQRICSALGTSAGRQLAEFGKPHEKFRVSRASDRCWEGDPVLTSRTDPAGDIARFATETERWPFGWRREHPGFNGYLDCELYGGGVVSSLIELFATATLRSFPGEEFIYCLRGPVLLRVGLQETLLDEGDAVSLWANEPHSCGPVKPAEPGQSPSLILSVRVEKPQTPRSRSPF